MARSQFQAYDSWILGDAVVTSTVDPLASYDLDRLKDLNPAARVRFGVDTVTITFTLPEARRARLFALPASNLINGALALTNGAGMNQAIAIQAARRNGIPYTAIKDLTVGWSAGQQTSDVWSLVITGNGENVQLGGAVWLGTTTETLEHDYSWGSKSRRRHHVTEQVNAHGTRYVVNRRTFSQSFELDFADASDNDRDAIRGWTDASFGRALPSIFWPDPDENDAWLGLGPEELEEDARFLDNTRIALIFDELSKGKPFA